MPEAKTLRRAKAKKQAGRAPSTQAGEFVREEMEHIREGKHGARSTRQAIAIGLSKARRAGIRLPARGKSKGRASAARRSRARPQNRPSVRRSRAILGVLRREPRDSASRTGLARHGRQAALKRGRSSRVKAARRAVKTKGPGLLREEARKAARTRKRTSGRR